MHKHESLDQNTSIIDELVHMVRLGAHGDVERLRIRATRLIRVLKAADHPMANTIQESVFGTQSHSKPRATGLRRTADPALSEPVPLDDDSGLEILRIEDPVVLPHALVYREREAQSLTRLIGEWRASRELIKAGLQPTKAVLFTGPPGVGKTLAARFVARELGHPLVVLDLATVISSFLGRTGNNVKQAFAFARRQPCVLFLDELDAVAKRRDDDSDIGELKRLVTVILQEIDLWPGDGLLLAATNHPQLLDTAVWRRFETVIDFSRPSFAELQVLGTRLDSSQERELPEWRRVLAVLLQGTSQSEFVRDLTRLRRTAVVHGAEQADELLLQMVSDRIKDLGKGARKELGQALIEVGGLSQRTVSRYVGLSRETLRQSIALKGKS